MLSVSQKDRIISIKLSYQKEDIRETGNEYVIWKKDCMEGDRYERFCI